MPSQEPPILAGCSSQDQQIFAARWVAVHTFLNQHLNITEEWRDLLMPEMQERLLKRFVQLEQDITAFSSDDTVARSRGRARWRDEFLLPLAESLNLRGKSLLTAIRRCQKRGYIQHRSRTGRRAQLESPERVRTRLDAVLDSSATTKQQAQALVATGICTTSADARMGLQALGD